MSVVSIMLLLTACGSDTVIKASLNSTRDVKEGVDVFLDQQIVGEVTDVTHSEDQTVLTIELDEEFAEQVKQNAAVVVNRLKAESPVEIYNQKATAEAVQNGQELKGLDSMFQLGAWMVGDSLDLGVDSLGGYVEAFQKYLQGSGWQKDRKIITDQANQAAKVAEETVKQATEEVNKVTTELGKVEGQVAAAVEQMGSDLAPVFGELAKSGQTIIQELEKFTNNLEQKGDGEKAAGTRFIQSLERVLETLNKSIEEGKTNQVPLNKSKEYDVSTNNNDDKPLVNLPEETESKVMKKDVKTSVEKSEQIAEDLIQEVNKNKSKAVIEPPKQD